MQYKNQTTKPYLEITLEILFFAVLFFGLSFMMADAETPALSVNTPPLNEEEGFHKNLALENTASYLSVYESIQRAQAERQTIDFEKELALKIKAEEILKKYENSEKLTEELLGNLENKAKVESILIGRRFGDLKFQLVQLKDYVAQLRIIAEETEDYAEKMNLDIQIAEMGEEVNKVEDFILSQEDKFSFFGWFVSML